MEFFKASSRRHHIFSIYMNKYTMENIMSMNFLTMNTLGIASNAGEKAIESLTGYLEKSEVSVRSGHGPPASKHIGD